MTSLVELRRQLILLGEAQSAITQCCALLGETKTSRIKSELSGAQQDVTDRINALVGR